MYEILNNTTTASTASKCGFITLKDNSCADGVITPAPVPSMMDEVENLEFETDFTWICGDEEPEKITSPKIPPVINVVGTLRENGAGTPLTTVTINDKDKPEPLTCAYMIQQLLQQAAETFPDITYVVGGNAFCDLDCITTVRQLGKHLIASIPANCAEAQALVDQYPQLKASLKKIYEKKPQPVYGCVQRGELFGVPVNLLLVYAPTEKSTSETFGKKAKKEQQNLTNKLLEQKSQEKFMATFSKLQAKAKYCKMELLEPELAQAQTDSTSTSTSSDPASSSDLLALPLLKRERAPPKLPRPPKPLRLARLARLAKKQQKHQLSFHLLLRLRQAKK